MECAFPSFIIFRLIFLLDDYSDFDSYLMVQKGKKGWKKDLMTSHIVFCLTLSVNNEHRQVVNRLLDDLFVDFNALS